MRNYIPREKKSIVIKYVACKMLDRYFYNSKIQHQLRLHRGYRVDTTYTRNHISSYICLARKVVLINIYIGLCDHHTYGVVLA